MDKYDKREDKFTKKFSKVQALKDAYLIDEILAGTKELSKYENKVELYALGLLTKYTNINAFSPSKQVYQPELEVEPMTVT